MKKAIIFFVLISAAYIFVSCNKEEPLSEKFISLTSNVWVADSLLADGEDVSGTGGLLEDFTGDTKFNDDGTGYVGSITGTWQFTNSESQIVITSDSLALPVTANIVELTATSLKLTTSFPDLTVNPPVNIPIRMTFVPK
jgi:hypothetical protein